MKARYHPYGQMFPAFYYSFSLRIQYSYNFKNYGFKFKLMMLKREKLFTQ